MDKSPLYNWFFSRLEVVRELSPVIVNDSLGLLAQADGEIHRFAQEHGFTVIVASTNLVFRELYEKAISAPETQKLLIIDRAPASRRAHTSVMKAPPPFYPDLLAETQADARIDLDFRQFLKEATGDPHWPQEVNESRYAKLMMQHLEAVLQAHRNLRNAHPDRFTDHDFKTIVAYAVLGMPEAAFKKMKAEDYWKFALSGHGALEALKSLAPEVTNPILNELRKAPSPFCWLADYDRELVIRAFYLSVILSQHLVHWKLLLANIDSDLARFSDIKPEILQEAVSKLISLNPQQAENDLESIEQFLSNNALQFLLLDQLKIADPPSFTTVILHEHYSTLIRSLALLFALDNLTSSQVDLEEHLKIGKAIFAPERSDVTEFIDKRSSDAWSHLKEAYWLAIQIRRLQNELARTVKHLKVTKSDKLNFSYFYEIWNEKRINRLEYYLSSLDRSINSNNILPRSEDELPSEFVMALTRIRKQTQIVAEDVYDNLDELNSRFQELVAMQYTRWIAESTECKEKKEIKQDKNIAPQNSDTISTVHFPLLTPDFLSRCLKPHWDPETEKAVVFIFDGMRYDIWDEFLRPMLEDRMEIIREYMASSLIPSETHFTRKAISAGTYPDEFDTQTGEDKLLKAGLAREFGYNGEVDVVIPEGMATGEVVRYNAGNLDVYILEMCDKELHKIPMKKLADGRQIPGRPLAFVYQQHLKNLVDIEVMAIMRGLKSGTKVFVIADHGFGRSPRDRIWLEADWLNEPEDCSYNNAWLRQSLKDIHAPGKVGDNVWEFPVSALRMRATETVYDRNTKQSWQKQYASIIFPKTGYLFSRPKAHFNPDAYSHGGISIQELMIPMAVLRVKSIQAGLLEFDNIAGPKELLEGEEAEFRLHINRTGKDKNHEVRVDVEAVVEGAKGSLVPSLELSHQVIYVGSGGAEVHYRFRPDPNDALDSERLQGIMDRTIAISLHYTEGQRSIRKSRSFNFTVRLNPEKIIRRVPTHLGKILGLTPKT